MKNKKYLAMALTTAMILSLTGCGGSSSSEQASQGGSQAVQTTAAAPSDGGSVNITTAAETTAEVEETVVDATAQKLSEVKSWSTITLKDNCSTSSDNTVVIDENKVTIKAAGYYEVSGSLSNGSLNVKCDDEIAQVVIKLNGVSITNAEKIALKVKQAGNVILYLADGTENTITSGKETVIVEKTDTGADDENSPTGGAVNAACDLQICGNGTLNANGYLKMGIHSKKTLTISSGTINVKSVANAIKGNDNVYICGGDITVLSGNDGIKAETSKEGVPGTVKLSGGKLNLTVYGDGVQSEGSIIMEAGKVNVAQSKEGFEAVSVTINGGELSIVSADDGINSSKAATAGEDVMVFNGGKVKINAQGDGIDSNGDIYVNGGEIYIDGPTKAKSGALDNGTENGGVLVVTGGEILAIGSTGNDKVFTDTSTQCAFEVHLNFSAGDTLTITDKEGNELCSYVTAKAGSSVVYSSHELKLGETYTVKGNGTSASIEQTATVVSDKK